MMTQNKIPYELSDYVLGKYFHTTGINQGWLPENGARVLVAVSGGGDSIALAWLFKKFYKGDVFIIHVNHGIRGQEADEDAEFVKSFFGDVIVKRVNVPEEKLKGESLEAAARRIRQQEICEHAKAMNIDTVFLGHNRDDLAETVLFNILRGTGLRGSVGITEQSNFNGIKFFRPLLGLRREYLRDLLRVRGISWREDSTNNSSQYTRNYIRLELLPIIESHINSSAIEHLAAFGEEMRGLREHEDSISVKLFEACKIECGDKIMMSRKILRTLSQHETALLIREIGRRLRLKTLSRNRCTELASLIQGTGPFLFQWCEGVNVINMEGKIIFEDKRNAK